MSDDLKQIEFLPEVIARIAPDLSLQRHLRLGLRPCLRSFREFRPLEVFPGDLQQLGKNSDSLVGSCIAKSGDSTAICGITAGIVEVPPSSFLEEGNDSHEAASVYPVVEIARGRSGALTDEEITISQGLYEKILHSKCILKKSLITKPGMIFQKENGDAEVVYSVEDTTGLMNKTYSFVLYASIKMFSRAGPLFDLCFNALVGALKTSKLPRIYYEDTTNSIKVPIRSRGNFGHLRRDNDVLFDRRESIMCPLALNYDEIGISSTFGVVNSMYDEPVGEDDMNIDKKTYVLADLEGDAEEYECISRVNVIPDSQNQLTSLSVCGGGARITKEILRECIDVAKNRSNYHIGKK